MSLAAELELNDKRSEFIADYVLKTLKLKGDKFTKLYNVEENKQKFLDFYEKQGKCSISLLFVLLCKICDF